MFDPVSTLRQWLPRTRSPEPDERLLVLYWNRAELKKELTRLQDERHKLREQLRVHEGFAAKAHEQLQQLELYLGNPETAPHALVYFQLRALWRECAVKLQRFAQQLTQQQSDRERRRQLIEFDQGRRRQLADLDRRLQDARAGADVAEAHLRLLQGKLSRMSGFWNYFRRRRLREEVAAEHARWDSLATQVTDLSDERAALESARAPEFPGISIDGKRIVNTAVIAYAQQLLVALMEGGLAMLANETRSKRVFDVNYGDRESCARMLQLLREASRAIEEQSSDLAGLKERTDELRASATYRTDADTVPLTDSIGTCAPPRAPVSGLETANRSGINVLIDDYWDVYQALLQ